MVSVCGTLTVKLLNVYKMCNMKVGITTELEIQYNVSKYGIMVSIPYGDCARYDHIWDINGVLLRVQIKTSMPLEDGTGFKFSGKNNSGKYNNNQVDGIATTFNGKCYFVPIKDCGNEIKLRYTLPNNCNPNQIKFAHDYELHRILDL